VYYDYGNLTLWENLPSLGWTQIASSSGLGYFNTVVNSSYYSVSSGGFPLTATGTQYRVVGTLDTGQQGSAPFNSGTNAGTAIYEANASGYWTMIGFIDPASSGVP
jgi:hypothetical protein